MVHKPSDEEENYFTNQEIANRKEEDFKKELDKAREKDIEMVSEQLNITDKELAAHLVDLGFGAATVAAFPLIPLVYVAWADGDVSNSERARISEIATARGLKPGSEAFVFLEDLLQRRPADGFLEICVNAVRRIYELFPDSEASDAKQDLVSLCVGIANASGGFLGVFGNKVSDSELATIREIVGDLGLDANDQTQDLLKTLG